MYVGHRRSTSMTEQLAKTLWKQDPLSDDPQGKDRAKRQSIWSKIQWRQCAYFVLICLVVFALVRCINMAIQWHARRSWTQLRPSRNLTVPLQPADRECMDLTKSFLQDSADFPCVSAVVIARQRPTCFVNYLCYVIRSAIWFNPPPTCLANVHVQKVDYAATIVTNEAALPDWCPETTNLTSVSRQRWNRISVSYVDLSADGPVDGAVNIDDVDIALCIQSHFDLLNGIAPCSA